MYSYRKRILSLCMVAAGLLATTITPAGFAKELPDALLITNLSNYTELVLENKELVDQIRKGEPPQLPDKSSVKQNIDKLQGLSKYALQFVHSKDQIFLGGKPSFYYYADDGFPYTVARKAFVSCPDCNPSYIQQTNHTFNTLIFNAYRSAVNTLEVTQPTSSVIGTNQSIELDWKINGVDKFYTDIYGNSKSHTNIHCINERPIEHLGEKDFTRHYSVDVISDQIKLNNSSDYHGSIVADSYGIYSCRVHVTDGYREILSRIFEFEVLDLRELSGSESKGVLSWDKEIYEINDRLILTFEDPDFNKDPNVIDTVEVKLWTDTDRGGLLFILRETSESSGMFREIISFCPECAGTRLSAMEGDLITAYVPSTGAIAHARIAGKVKPWDRISITSTSFVDEQANRLGEFDLLVNQEVSIQTNITNNQKRDQEIRLIVQIKDSANATVLLTSKRILVPALASLTINQPWIPTEGNVYSIEVFIWRDFENPSPLTGAKHTDVTVEKSELEKYRFVSKWGGSPWSAPTFEDGKFVLPKSIVSDNMGFIYVGDETRIQKFSAKGTFIKKWGSYCDIYTREGCVDPDGDGPLELGDGQFINPYITTDNNGNIYALESIGRVQKFDNDGNLLTKWNVTQSIGFIDSRVIAVDKEGFVYLGDMKSNRILRFTNDGKFVGSWGGECILVVHENKTYGDDPCRDPDGSGPLEIGDGQFASISGITFDSQGFAYIADTNNHRIQKLTSDGKFVTKWGVFNPVALAASNDGFVYVAHSENQNIQKFTQDGELLSKWGGSCEMATSLGCEDPDESGPLEVGDGQFLGHSGIAVDSDGFVYIVERTNERVQKFTSDGKFVTKWGKPKSFDGLLSFPTTIAVDKDDNVYVAGGNYNRIQKFSSNGTFLLKWGSTGSGLGEFMFPNGITVSNDGFVYVADSENGRIQKFTTDGKFVSSWGSIGTESEGMSYPYSIATDPSGNVYIFDGGNRVLKFDSEVRFITRWGSFCTLFGIEPQNIRQFPEQPVPAGTGCVDPDGSGPLDLGDGQFMSGSIAVDPTGYVYVSDVGNKRTQKFTLDDKFVAKFDFYGIIATDEQGNVYVIGTDTPYVRKFDSSGNMLAKIRIKEFETLIALAVDKSGNVYVLDGYLGTVQKFSPFLAYE